MIIMKKRIVTFAIVLCMAVSLFTGCGKMQDKIVEEAGSPVSITMAGNPFIGQAPFYIAMDKGFFEENGIEFSIVNFDESSSSLSALVSGKVDMATVTLDAAIITQSKYKEDTVKICSVKDESLGADGILVKNDIESLSELKGKTVGVSLNQTTHYLLLKALKSVGLSDEDVVIKDMTSSDAAISFISGGVDAAVTWEPYLSDASNSGAGKIIFSSADAPGTIVDVIAINAKNTDADWIDSFYKAYDMALDFLNDEVTHDEAVSIVSKYLEVEVSEIENMLKGIKLYYYEDSKSAMKSGEVAYKAVSDISDFYNEKKVIQRTVTPEEMFGK